MLLNGVVGPQSTLVSLAPGANGYPVRLGNMGDLIASELHGRYYEANYRRSLFNASTQVATAVAAGLVTAYTGLVLSNPIVSPVNLVLTKIGIALTVAPAAIAALGLALGYNSGTNVTHTTPGTPRSKFFGVGASGTGLVDTSATLPTAPFLAHPLWSGFTAAALPASSPALPDMEGSIILPPGAYACIYALTTVTGLFSFDWEEVPI